MENYVLELQRERTLVINLAKEMDYKNGRLLEMEQKYNEASTTLSTMKQEYKRLHETYIEEMRRMQFIGLLNDQLKQDLESQKTEYEKRQTELETCTKELEKREVQLELERKSLVLDKEKLELQRKQMEERKLSARKRKESDSPMDFDDSLIDQINDLRKELEEKADDMHYMESLNQTLFIKEHKSNQEILEVRKELMTGLQSILSNRTTIGIKRMGEVDPKPFQDMCLKKFSGGDCEMKSRELSSSWQESVKDPNWHPFKMKVIDGKLQECIDEDDDRLREVRDEWGEAVYNAVADALLELNEYNPSGRYAVSEFWNYKENKKASLKEVVQYTIKQLNTHKRKK